MARITDNDFSPHRDCPQCDCLMFLADVDCDKEQAEYICTGCAHRLIALLEREIMPDVMSTTTRARIRVSMKTIEANLSAYDSVMTSADPQQAASADLFRHAAWEAAMDLQEALNSEGK